MSAEENKALVDRMYEEGLNEHRTEGGESYWKPDMVWRGPGGIGTRYGVQDFQDNFQKAFLRAFPDKHTTDDIRIAEGEYVAAMGRVEATHSADWLGIPATGKPVTIRYMDFWRVEDGKLAENWVMIDIIDFMQQIGFNPFEHFNKEQ